MVRYCYSGKVDKGKGRQMVMRYRHSQKDNPLPHGQHKPFGNATYREIGGPTGHLSRREEFRGNSMRAEWDEEREGVWFYKVYSYDLLIGLVNSHREVYLFPPPKEYKSKTTSRHFGLCKAWLDK